MIDQELEKQASDTADAEHGDVPEQETEGAVVNEAQESVVSIEDKQVTDSAFTVVEAANPEKMAAAIEEGNVVPVPQKSRNNRSKKKKKKKLHRTGLWISGMKVLTQRHRWLSFTERDSA